MLDTTLIVADVIKLLGDKGSDLGSSDGSFDGSNYGNIDGSLLGYSPGSEVETDLVSFHGALERNYDGIFAGSSFGDSLGYTDLFVIGCNGGIKPGLSDGKVAAVCSLLWYGVKGCYYIDGTSDGRLEN